MYCIYIASLSLLVKNGAGAYGLVVVVFSTHNYRV